MLVPPKFELLTRLSLLVEQISLELPDDAAVAEVAAAAAAVVAAVAAKAENSNGIVG